MKSLDRNGAYTLLGVYEECSELLDSRLYKVNYGKGKYIKHVNYKVFKTIVMAYMREMLNEVVNGNIGTLYNRFGELYAVKSKAIRYNPYTWLFKKVDGKTVRERVKVDLNKTNGYVFFVFWNAPKIYRHYKLKLSRTWNKKLLDNVLIKNMEVLDITMNKYGRNASPTYIQKIK
jgi:hypothetical protein